MRCLIVDDEPPAREGMRKLLLAHGNVEIIGEASDVRTALELLQSEKPEVVFLDVQLRGETGFDLIARATEPLPQIVFTTAHDRYAARAFRVEAVDYLLKPVDPEHLSEALQRLQKRIRKGSAGVVRKPIAHPAALRTLGLTAREAEVLFWLAQGKSNPEIGTILSSSAGTVKKQVQSILKSLGVASRVNAALIAAEVLGPLQEP